ncbi:MAG: nicotinate-nucleotide--dimethylbenzimidazole phosphoribosyltransferase [Elusimicrobiota bacterium]|nr:nicotinate-nucleotide--dimethylbenzimidazole phosphoribosyltransferase [Endomicrobiia bacterium]MDW8166658.1 nicotinate-nucleotide--dimethylbenzimidazole phosphoribosyltransferase [Elusimicrobiota bacterium]
MNSKIKDIINNIESVDYSVIEKTQYILDNLTKPKDSLGDLEEICKKVAAITHNPFPKVSKKFIFVLAGDHGIAEENVSAYPQEVTSQMVLNFINAKAAINVFAKHIGGILFIVDVGVKGDFSNISSDVFINKKINYGTNNFLKNPAMSKEEAEKAILCGIEIIEEVLSNYYKEENETFLIAIGDMGIANTTVASAITALITGVEVEKVVGRGTGVDEVRFKNKINAVKKVLQKYDFDLNDVIDIISKIGGYEIAAMVGIILACARYKLPVILDGFIVTSAALLASCLSCKVREYLFAGHISKEPGHKVQLEFLGLKPILDLNMGLGEATGACLAMSIIELSCKIIHEMATFETAGVSKSL